MNDDAFRTWIETKLGHAPHDIGLFRRALTHGSYGSNHYERLEFLGDRVLGLIAGAWLYELFPDEPEGNLSRRLNAIVSRETCAEIGREITVSTHLLLGKQARDDGATDSDNVLGDVMEALIGALYLEAGLDAARNAIRTAWGDRPTRATAAPQHPKSALQEWAAAHNRKAPSYDVIDRSGPHHAPRFTVKASLGTFAEVQAEGGSKQEAETAAAAALLAKVTG